jgi:hypothetical protein
MDHMTLAVLNFPFLVPEKLVNKNTFRNNLNFRRDNYKT